MTLVHGVCQSCIRVTEKCRYHKNLRNHFKELQATFHFEFHDFSKKFQFVFHASYVFGKSNVNFWKMQLLNRFKKFIK